MPTTIIETISRLSVLAFSLLLLVAFTYTSAEAQESTSDAVVTDFLNVYNSRVQVINATQRCFKVC